MAHLFTCPHCQSQTLVDERFSGRSGKCFTCGRAIRVPEFSGSGGAAVGAETAGRRWRWPQVGLREAMAALLMVVVVGVLGFTGIRYGVTEVRTLQVIRTRGRCMSNLERIAAALNAYAADYGSYPPPQTVNAAGAPLQSWRVLILPYLGYTSLYDSIDRELPWSHETNMLVTRAVPSEFRSPVGLRMSGYESHYALITGPGTLFPPNGPLGPNDVSDDPSQTLLVVEFVPPSLTTLSHWTEPVDLTLAQMRPSIGTVPGTEIGGNHEGGATAVTVDGRGRFLRESLDPPVLRALITPQGGERLPDDVLD
jgi:hypothetical protein